MSKYVKLEDVEDLLKLIKERDMYQDWSKPYEELDEEIKIEIAMLKITAIEIE